MNIEKKVKNLNKLCESLDSFKKIYFFPTNEQCDLKNIREQILENLLNKNNFKNVSSYFKRWIMAHK